MKTVFNVILGLCALVLIYICYTSIMGPTTNKNKFYGIEQNLYQWALEQRNQCQ